MNPIKSDFADQGVEFFAVNIYEDAAGARRYIDGAEWDYMWVRAEDSVPEKLGIKGIPFLIVLDREGKVAWHSGPFTAFMGGSDLRRALTEATRG